MRQAILNMLKMQEEMNTRVNESWRDQNFEWYRAVWIECAELMDHYGYKWWKHHERDMSQVKLEVVDIWHFGMSTLLQEQTDHQKLAEKIEKYWRTEASTDKDYRDLIEALAAEVLATQKFSISIFSELARASELSFTNLYVSYIGKNVLNFFRQDHGYKEGKYKKIWAGKEDNDHLNELLDAIDNSEENFSDILYDALTDRYFAHSAS